MTNLQPTFSDIELFSRLAAALGAEQQRAHATITADFTVASISDSFQTMVAEAELLPKGWSLFDLPEFVGTEEIITAILRGDQTHFTIERVSRVGADGMERYLSFRLLAMHEEMPNQGLLLIVEDETREGKLEQELVQERNELRLAKAKLQTLNRLKFVFMSMIVHDLRTPLSAILGFSELIKIVSGDELSEESHDYLSKIYNQAIWMNQMIKDVLMLDQIDSGLLQLQREPFSLNELLQETTKTILPNLEIRKQSLELELPADDIQINGDQRRIGQVIFNLLSNASKYSPQNKPISISLTHSEGGAQLQVQDKGAGMSHQDMEGLFQIYYRTENAKKSEKAGTGLGLYIVKSLVDSHGGRVWAESEVGTGSTFYVWLPTS